MFSPIVAKKSLLQTISNSSFLQNSVLSTKSAGMKILDDFSELQYLSVINLITLLCSGGFQTLEKKKNSFTPNSVQWRIYINLYPTSSLQNVIQLLLVNGYYALFLILVLFLFLSTGDSDPMPEMMTDTITSNVIIFWLVTLSLWCVIVT